jgi:hypothetical protein
MDKRTRLHLSAGTYHLMVSDSNHCVTTKDITLSQPPVFVTQLSSQILLVNRRALIMVQLS